MAKLRGRTVAMPSYLTISFIRDHLFTLPVLAKFAIGMVMLVAIPRLSRRLHVPGAVGLLLGGVIIGPYVLGIFGTERPIADFLAELGKLLLMFFAGLEIDLALFRRARNRSIALGIVTTVLPLLLGTSVGLVFGYATIPAIVIGSLLASHTLLGLTAVDRLGLGGLEPVTVTVGATVISDTLSLVVFAICVSIYTTGFSPSGLSLLLAEIIGYIVLVLFGLSRLGAYVLKRVEKEEDAYFIVMLSIMAIAGVLADAIQLPGIVGAFLAGLAVNASAHGTPASAKLEFLGKSLFIPIFFVVTGFLINPITFVWGIFDNFLLVASIVGALLLGKWMAAWVIGHAFGYTLDEELTIWSLTLPQVAATLAATLVAHETLGAAGQRLLDDRMLNVVLVLVFATSILGPVLTELFAPRLATAEPVSS
jgi:Kef-type K+ transport system membrane component KefB